MKKTYIIYLILSLLFLSCDKEDDIIVDKEKNIYDIQDSSDPVKHFIYDFYNQYGSVILMEYDEIECKWNMTYSDEFEWEIIEKSQYSNAIEYSKKTFLNLYDDSFKKKYFPFKILMAKKIYKFDSDLTYEKVLKKAIAGKGYICIGDLNDNLSSLTEDEIKEAKGKINAEYWLRFMRMNKYFTFPDNFSSVSKGFYVDYFDGDQESLYEKGFVWGEISMWGSYYPELVQDRITFLQFIFAHTTSEMDEICSKYPLIKAKYEILVNAMKEQCGFDLRKNNQ